jgi:hypothetical protein
MIKACVAEGLGLKADEEVDRSELVRTLSPAEALN